MRHAPSLRLQVLTNQLRNPLLALLGFAALTSALTSAWADATVITTIVLASVTIGFRREYVAQTALAALRSRLQSYAIVERDGREQRVPVTTVSVGDTVVLTAGCLVPADATVIESNGCQLNESALTGESFPVGKEARGNARATEVYRGTTVVTGSARARVTAVGDNTRFGGIEQRLAVRAPTTEFERGMRRFGYLLTIAMAVIVAVIFMVHALAGRPFAQSLLFATALAIGLSPELLPAILSVSLAHGATAMARVGVVVRRLEAIENLGSMNVLCTDKTGTLTVGVVGLEGAYDEDGAESAEVLALAVTNARQQRGVPTPLDATLAGITCTAPDTTRLAELPFEAKRKRASVVVAYDAEHARIITKGAFASILGVCGSLASGTVLDANARKQLEERYETWSRSGMRVLAIADRIVARRATYDAGDERDLVFRGFVTFLDRPKDDAAAALRALAAKGVRVKLVTGDTALTAQYVARLVGMEADALLRGSDIAALDDATLDIKTEATSIFAEVDPQQKERIVRSLRRSGHVVGFLGDGVNDAPAMHAADTSISVEHAVDVARAAADFVLLDPSLDVIRRGIELGRVTFANTTKYVLITTSANLGNMISMALASLVLPFLPLLPSQILLNNLLADIPAVGIATDAVDPELVERPRRWRVATIARFMVVFGLVSSLFDALTFVVLLSIFATGPEAFRTGWFVESLLTEVVIVFVMRTRRPLWRSKPSILLVRLAALVAAVALLAPMLPGARLVDLVALPPLLLATVILIAVAYVALTELVKWRFYARPRSQQERSNQ